MLQALEFLLALALVVGMMLVYVGLVRLVTDPGSALWRARERRRLAAVVRHETADLDRAYASLVDEYRHIP